MLEREMKVNFKNFIIWLGILIGLFLFVYLLYPSIIKSGKLGEIDELLKIFPPEVLKSFNMDIASMDTVFGWIKTEGWVFVLLITGIYSSLLGGNILLKEENDKTIEYLACLPISRNKIVIDKFICGLVYISLLVILFGLFNYNGLLLSGNFDKNTFICLSITPLFSSLVLYSLCLFISTYLRKTKKVIGIALGITFASYLFNMLAELSVSIEWLKYISVFTLSDIRNVIINGSINYWMIIISIVLIFVFVFGTLLRYKKKEFI